MNEYVYSRRKPSIPRMILKLAAALFLGLFLWAGMLVMLENAADASWSANEARMVNMCDGYYYRKDYARLLDELQLYDLYGEPYDIYWEAVNGYSDYIAWQQWSQVSEEQIEGSEAKAMYYRDQVLFNAENCAFEKNRKSLEGWKELMEAAQVE